MTRPVFRDLKPTHATGEDPGARVARSMDRSADALARAAELDARRGWGGRSRRRQADALRGIADDGFALCARTVADAYAEGWSLLTFADSLSLEELAATVERLAGPRLGAQARAEVVAIRTGYWPDDLGDPIAS